MCVEAVLKGIGQLPFGTVMTLTAGIMAVVDNDYGGIFLSLIGGNAVDRPLM